MKKLHPRAVWLFFVKWFSTFLGVFISIVVFIEIIMYGILEGGNINDLINFLKVTLKIGLLVVLFGIIFSYIWARLSYHFYRYEFTDKEFKQEYGVIIKHYIFIPYERIQNIDIHRGILERILGLSNLYFQTAGAGGVLSAEGKLPGLSKEEAEKLKEETISKITQLKNQGL
jgi:hypothetical protein